MVSEMTFFISSISAEVCRGKKTNPRLRYRVGSVRSLFNKWLGWFGWAGEELPWFFFKMISDRVSRLRLWQRAASPSMCFVSSEEKTYRWTMSRFDPESLVILTSCFKKKQAPQTLEEPPEDLPPLADVFIKTAKHFSALTSPDKTY